MSKLKKAAKVLFLPLKPLNKALPKNNKKVLFYSNLGFRDNVRAVYDYMISNGFNSDFKITVATDEYKLYKKQTTKNVKFVSTLGGISAFLTSKFVFYSFGKYPIKPARDQRVVNLWHGMPLKNIGRLEEGHRNDDQNFFTDIIATSPFFADIMCRAFGAEQDCVLLTSQPRCDDMFKETQRPKIFKGFKKVIFWLPTFFSSKRLGLNDADYGEINPHSEKFLQGINSVINRLEVLLVIKLHPMDDSNQPKNEFSNILFVNDNVLSQMGYNLHSFLTHSDALITDYSSIYFDYLMLDKPIAFADSDDGSYSKNRGFTVDDISELMPGCHIKTSDEFADFVLSVAEGRDDYKEQREACNQRCNLYKGGGCERVLAKIGLLKSEEN